MFDCIFSFNEMSCTYDKMNGAHFVHFLLFFGIHLLHLIISFIWFFTSKSSQFTQSLKLYCNPCGLMKQVFNGIFSTVLISEYFQLLRFLGIYQLFLYQGLFEEYFAGFFFF